MMHTLVIADAHLEDVNEELEYFLAFLFALQKNQPRIFYILGDLFNIWLGPPKMQLAHQLKVTQALQTLRNAGMLIKYIEGNRDYFLSPFYLNAPFTTIVSEYAQEWIGNKRLYFAHGDLVNIHDKQYRLWRKVSRNRITYAGFQYLPRSSAIRFVQYLEQKLRGTNQKHKSSFPLETCRTFAWNLLNSGYDTVILGHFHKEHQQSFLINEQSKYLYSLPAWKDTHKYLQINEHGECSFQKFIL